VVSLVALIETILNEGAKHAVLLVNAVEKRANMTILAKGIPGEVRGAPGGSQGLTFKESHVPARCTGSARTGFDPAGRSGETGLRRIRSAYARPPPLSTGGRSC
jgi:hypothetical protein